MQALRQWQRGGGDVFAIIDGRARKIAQVYAPSRYERGNAVEELEAIGGLIAAAPDLLLALANLLPLLDTESNPDLRPYVDAARAAIAKSVR